METKVDIKDMICQAYHEIYNQPLDQEDLEDLFTHQQHEEPGVDTYKDQWAYVRGKYSIKNYEKLTTLHSNNISLQHPNTKINRLKYSFSNPVVYKLPQDAPLDEVNDLLVRFTFIVNLYYIDKFFRDTSSDQFINGKRRAQTSTKEKYNEYGLRIPDTYYDLPVEDIVDLVPRFMKLMCLHLKAFYTEQEVQEILKYIQTSYDGQWEPLQCILNAQNLFLEPSVDKRGVSRNFDVYYEVEQIAQKATEWLKTAQDKTYKRHIDHFQIIVCTFVTKIHSYLKACIDTKGDEDSLSNCDTILQMIIYYWNQYFTKIHLQSFDQVSIILFLNEFKQFAAEIMDSNELYTEANKIFENTVDHHLYDLFMNENRSIHGGDLNLQVKKTSNQTKLRETIQKFKQVVNYVNSEEQLYVDLDRKQIRS